MYLLGIDIGTSSIKASILDANTKKPVASAQYPETEAIIHSPQKGWAEQDPNDWWGNTIAAIKKLKEGNSHINLKEIKAIGIAYQMHGLVMVDKDQKPIRNSIIWCDSRAVEIGNDAFERIGKVRSLSTLLNSPGNFTASKLAWVSQYEKENYQKIHKIMLPGDYIAMMLTGEITTSIPALSEGTFWDFQSDEISKDIISTYNLNKYHIPEIRLLFSAHGTVKPKIAEELGLTPNIPVTYKAGDQPNNALSLNVMEPGEVAATAGTSGVIYGVSGQLTYDKQSRINTFAHVNYKTDQKRTGVLLCINSCGSLYRWAKNTFAPELSYKELNQLADQSPIGANGIIILPFGNGAERMLNNSSTGTQLLNIDLNIHSRADIFRAVQESIAFAFRYGLDIMRENGMEPKIIRAGKANLFQSELFVQTFADVTGIPVELHENDGATGAAIGAGIGAGLFTNKEAFPETQVLGSIKPKNSSEYEPIYQNWKKNLGRAISLIL